MKRILLSLVLLPCFLFTYAQISVDWLYKADASGDYQSKNFILDENNNMYAVYSFPADYPIEQLHTLKINSEGNLEWENNYLTLFEVTDVVYSGGYLFYLCNSFGKSGMTYKLNKVDSSGNHTDLGEIVNYYGCGYGFSIFKACLTEYNDSLYMATSKWCVDDPCEIDKIATDLEGEVISWRSGSGFNVVIEDVLADNVGGIYYIYYHDDTGRKTMSKFDNQLNWQYGYAPVTGFGNNGTIRAVTFDEVGNAFLNVKFPDNDFQFVRLNQNGDLMMIANYEHPVSGYAYNINEMLFKNDKLFVVGSSNEQDKPNILTACFDFDGNLLWEDTYYTDPERSGSGAQILVDDKGHVFSYGYKSHYAYDYADLFMRVFDVEGNILTDFTYNSEGDAHEVYGNGIIQDSRIYLQGLSDNFPTVLCLEVADDLFVSETNKPTLTLFPNPTHDEINIQLNQNLLSKEVKLIIWNTLGKKIKEFDILQNNQKISLKLDTGIYIVNVASNNYNSYSQKLIVK